jgi:hypothetical protein
MCKWQRVIPRHKWAPQPSYNLISSVFLLLSCTMYLCIVGFMEPQFWKYDRPLLHSDRVNVLPCYMKGCCNIPCFMKANIIAWIADVFRRNTIPLSSLISNVGKMIFLVMDVNATAQDNGWPAIVEEQQKFEHFSFKKKMCEHFTYGKGIEKVYDRLLKVSR